MSLFFAGIYSVLALGMLLSLYGIWRGPTLADRAVAFDVFAAAVMIWVLLYSLQTGVGELMDVLLISAFLAFLGTTALSYLIEKRKGAL